MKNRTRQYIIVKLQVEGLHSWPDAKTKVPRVGFLSEVHRHIFHIKMKVEVKHGDRDIEIILFKREVEDYLQEQYYDSVRQTLFFEHRSCEMLAVELAQRFNACEVEVLEDGENGAVVEWEPSVASKIQQHIATFLTTPHRTHDKPTVVFVTGWMCAGKTTVANQLVEALHVSDISHQFIEVSDIVRALVEADNRTSLQDPTLDTAIATEIAAMYDESVDVIVISGVRQWSIVQALCNPATSRFSRVETWWITAEYNERKRRYKERSSVKDATVTFEEAVSAEEKIYDFSSLYDFAKKRTTFTEIDTTTVK